MEQNVGGSERKASSLAGGTLLLLAATGRVGWPLGLMGGALLFRGLTGSCSVYKQLGISSCDGGHHLAAPGSLLSRTVKVQKTVTIKSTPAKVYAFWRNFENLPRFMENLNSVRESEGGMTHWNATGPGGSKLEWTAKIHEDTPDQRISWSTLPDGEIQHNGSVSFMAAPMGRGTEVRVVLRYDIPGGVLGQALAKLSGDEPGQQIDADLRRLKQVMETGEVARTDGQSAGAGRDTRGQMSTNDALLNA